MRAGGAPSCPRPVPELLFTTTPSRRARRCAISTRAATALWKPQLRDGHGRCRDFAADVGPSARRHPRRHARPRRRRGALPDRRHLPRHPARALPAGDRRAGIPSSAQALRRWLARTAPTKLALVHGDVSPKNILVGPDGPGAAGRRVRLVRRPGLRPRLLPQPPAAEVLVDARGRRAASSPASTRWPRPISRASIWEPRGRARGAAATPAAGLFLARVDGKSPVEYLTDEARKELRPRASRGRAPRRAAATADADPRTPGPGGAALMTRPRIAARARPPRLGQPRPADGRGRGGAGRRRRRAVPSRPPGASTGSRRGGRSARRRRSASAASTCHGAVASVKGRSRRRSPACDAADQAAIDAAPDRARRHAATRRGSAATPPSRSRWPWPTLRPQRRGLPLWR